METNKEATLFLKERPTIADIQEYVRKLEKIRGFEGNGILQNTLQLGEEIGELFKAIRKAEKMRTDANSKFTSVEEELADILIYLCSVANRYNIDLEEAFRNKEEVNRKRNWT